MLWIIFIALSLIFYVVLHHRPHIIQIGHFNHAKFVNVENKTFYIEEVEFRDSQAAIHGYFNITPALQNRAEVLETPIRFF
ncbi:hypothetical protein BKK51_01290 [Rodentibacter trehalosifermentans]|uniref:Uncharacterized protein n=1 Tax=Rodentibacter trehalosifermentans TaxID=1908263 RepID=A0A1V3IX24_9PAST|nr:hypothetical protein [Rodentibacter trehalosifermentans]OOF46874.1 hypothetical protein BKK51_01290 [Rodentibacter trehalosifermentans]